MRTAFSILFCCIAGLFFCSQAPAAEASTLLATTGKILFEDDFGRRDLAPKWRLGKGTFSINDGVVTGAAIPDDKHGAYIYSKANFTFKDIVVEYSAKLEGARELQFILDDSMFKESHLGHILRATLMPDTISLADYKFGLMRADYVEKMKDPKVTAEERKKLKAEIEDKLALYKIAIAKDAWHLVRIEIVEDEILVRIDGEPVGYLKSKGIAHATKNVFRFEIVGSSCAIKTVKVWEATLSAGWAGQKDTIVGALKK